MKRIKIKIENFIYEHITKWYVKLTNKRNHNLDIIIGKGGKDIDNLTENLTEYFGKKVNVNLIETKTNFA